MRIRGEGEEGYEGKMKLDLREKKRLGGKKARIRERQKESRKKPKKIRKDIKKNKKNERQRKRRNKKGKAALLIYSDKH